MSRYRKIENLVYAVFWLLVIAFTAVSGWSLAGEHTLAAGRRILVSVLVSHIPLFCLFLIHDIFIAPLFVYRDRKKQYFMLTATLMLLFVGMQVYPVVKDRERHDSFTAERRFRPYERPGEHPGHGRGMHGGPRSGDVPAFAPGRPFSGGFHSHPLAPLSPEMASILIAFLMISANLGVKYVCHAAEEREKLKTLENENLGQQLQYLRYQINPHFFMNTLNNIHALVDIDPVKAKTSILELSKLMRYLLYEGARPTIPISKEVEFLKQYVALMRMRYADDLEVRMELPEGISEGEVPPLVFVTFVENAFKHGISYEGRSFISVSMSVKGRRLSFRCVNSMHPAPAVDKCSGIGLDNVRKRLTLLYGSDYSMDIAEKDGMYDLHLEIPVKK